MKKTISILLVIVLLMSALFVLTGCDKETATDNTDEGTKELDYANSTAADLLEHIADKDNLTTDEFKWLISTYSNVKINDDFTLEDNITDEALDEIKSSAYPPLGSYIADLIKSDAPQVRGYVVSQMRSLFGVSDSNLDLAKDLLKNEKDPYVIYKAATALSNELKSDEAIAEFFKKISESDNALIRKAAVQGFANSWSKDVEGATDIVIKMMNDTDKDVRKAACSGAGNLGDEAVIEPLVKILNNPDDYEIHGSCIDGLVDLWYDFPFFEKTSEKAYKATMDYLKKTPRTENVPYWTTVGSFKTTSTQDSFTKWKEKATYFKEDEIYNVMVDIIKDENANWLGRSSAIDVIKAHCSEEKYKSLKPIIEGLTDSKASLLQSSYKD